MAQISRHAATRLHCHWLLVLIMQEFMAGKPAGLIGGHCYRLPRDFGRRKSNRITRAAGLN
jgi:hypothetical protein